MTWATIEQVAEHVGVPQDDRMTQALAVAQAWCQRIRPDLSPTETPNADVQHAVVLYAALLYRERATPAGFSAYGDLDTNAYTDQSAMMNIYRLLGTRKPVAR